MVGGRLRLEQTCHRDDVQLLCSWRVAHGRSPGRPSLGRGAVDEEFAEKWWCAVFLVEMGKVMKRQTQGYSNDIAITFRQVH